jgi:hypothetical protein
MYKSSKHNSRQTVKVPLLALDIEPIYAKNRIFIWIALSDEFRLLAFDMLPIYFKWTHE